VTNAAQSIAKHARRRARRIERAGERRAAACIGISG
jgi:hypothetical protein